MKTEHSEDVKFATSNAYINEIAGLVAPPEKFVDEFVGTIKEQLYLAMVIGSVTGVAPTITLKIDVVEGVAQGLHIDFPEDAFDAFKDLTEDEIFAKSERAIKHRLNFMAKKTEAMDAKKDFMSQLLGSIGNTEAKDLENAVEDAEEGFASEGQGETGPATSEPEANTTAAPQEAPAEDKAA